MTKAKQNNTKLKRRIRKTFGAIFLISALIVAAIPVDSLKASTNAGSQPSITLTKEKSGVPEIGSNEIIFQTANAMYRFAYVDANGLGNRVAVILAYNDSTYESNGVLNIPAQMDGFLPYIPQEDSPTANNQLVAASSEGDYLYFRIENSSEEETTYEYKLCDVQYMDKNGGWVSGANGGEASEMYYARNHHPNLTNTGDFVLAEGSHSWVHNASVQYIANQTLTADGVAGPWITPELVEEGSAHGVFAEKGEIHEANFPTSMRGIGDYAFYKCTGLSSVTLQTGLNTIGNHAFEGCINMSRVTLPDNCNLNIIGDHAFHNCQMLSTISIPVSTEYIGDGAFENCINLTNIVTYRSDMSVSLHGLGNHMLKGCIKLSELLLPLSVEGGVDLGIVEGCESLQKITAYNREAYFTESSYTFSDFSKMVNENFYFEGVKTSENDGDTPNLRSLHGNAFTNGIAFKFLNMDVYEMAKIQNVGGTQKRAIFRVNSQNQLTYCGIDQGMTEVTIPGYIGPYSISSINESGFRNNCSLQKIIIPETITSISDGAFQGCHNLKDVVFENADAIISLGDTAFKTQVVGTHQSSCPMSKYDSPTEYLNSSAVPQSEKDAYLNPSLSFAGNIGDNLVYNYAMNPNHNVNIGSQKLAYIEFYSGWPTNLKVQYSPETQQRVLMDYPTYAGLTDYTLNSYPYMDEAKLNAAYGLVNKLTNHGELTEDETNLYNALRNIVLPVGIDAVQNGLFASKEKDERTDVDKSLTTYGITEIPAKSFSGCKNMTSISILGECTSVGDYAFENCERLKELQLSEKVTTLGKIPFTGCPLLEYVSFSGNNKYVCENAIIYKMDGNTKDTVVECLESRGYTVGSSTITAEELNGVKKLSEEAFFDCSALGSVDLKETEITEIPDKAFGATSSARSTIYSVLIPSTCRTIQANAFKNSGVRYVEIPNSVSVLDPSAFNTNKNSPNPASAEDDGIAREKYHEITFYCEANSNAAVYADMYDNILVRSKPSETYYTVTFYGKDGNKVLSSKTYLEGSDAVAPEPPEVVGYVFDRWDRDFTNIHKDLEVVAIYKEKDPNESKYKVSFYDYDETWLSDVYVSLGEDAVPPTNPTREGYVFTGWIPSITNITENRKVYAQYEKAPLPTYNVTFLDYADNVIKIDHVEQGGTAVPPSAEEVPAKDGYVFSGWRPGFEDVQSDLTIYAQYEIAIPQTFVVRFIDYNDDVIDTQQVEIGKDAVEPQHPTRDGYEFTGWRPSFTNVQSDLIIYAQYERLPDPTPTPTPTPSATPTPSPTATVDPSSSPSPTATVDPSSSPSASPSATPTTSPTASATPSVFYTLTVKNGSGSGSYIPGAQVIVIADNPVGNQEFSSWSVDPSDVVVASKEAMGTVITMPEKNVTMTANYKAKSSSGGSGSTTGGGSGTGSGTTTGGTTGGTTGKQPTSGSSSNNGTTVVINKNGLSNANYVAVVVNGSSDNFVVKFQENSATTESTVRALMASYGDLSYIAYFPVEIALYDATGDSRITDTTGLSISVTLPIPDSMIKYAGNNKVAYVGNDKVEEIPVKFKTINGVACMTFEATKFQPASYCVYVDTANLSAEPIKDSTPKTGDGIHPKWFLSIGLFCISIFLFLKKDKKNSMKLA